MEKVYKATNFYYFKMILLIVIILLISNMYIFIFSTFLNLGYVVDMIIAIIFGLISLFAIYIVIISNKPVVSIEQNTLKYRYHKFLFSEIDSFHPSRGGSEPYIITKEGKRIDMELSWLRKQDRQEIEEIIQTHLNDE